MQAGGPPLGFEGFWGLGFLGFRVQVCVFVALFKFLKGS